MTNVLDGGGKYLLPGVVDFSLSAGAGLRVDPIFGNTTLTGNHYEPATLTAVACNSGAKATIDVSCNLDPVAEGDVDLGATQGVPLNKIEVGETLRIPVRVNTDMRKLSFFNLRILYEPSQFEVVGVEHTIPSKDAGSVKLSVGTTESGEEILIAGTISNSQVRGGRLGVQILQMTVKAKVAAVSQFSGTVVQLLDTTLGNPQPIGSPNAPFRAGSTAMLVKGNGRARRVGVDRPPGTHRSVYDSGTAARTHRRESDPGSAAGRVNGDTNCDGVFDGKDVLFVLDYVAARGNAFTTKLGKIIRPHVAACQTKYSLPEDDVSFLDADDNTAVDLLDLTLLLGVFAERVFFWTSSCSLPPRKRVPLVSQSVYRMARQNPLQRAFLC